MPLPYRLPARARTPQAIAWLLTMFCLSAAWGGRTLYLQALSRDLSEHRLAVVVCNGRADTYLWLDPRVAASVWEADADAGDDAVAYTTATLELPGRALGSGYQVEARDFARGTLVLPPEFELQRYIRSGYRLRLAAPAVPRGYYGDGVAYQIDPTVEFGNAFGSVRLRPGFSRRTIGLDYAAGMGPVVSGRERGGAGGRSAAVACATADEAER
ncbi:hypothetical protein SAMN04487939_11827 [Lysobacter sp. yr284]|uniref:hypothetical protein n=1 Tax=Lysobacter sp. yr284 TaxID=1761791 RepID=UPI0008999306|nr:hypothetical protein [Lysobacter sp. yr284]SDZ14394.1 hypothetical protein SAMN04487939_11827 [Lysobacter sp. yr284]